MIKISSRSLIHAFSGWGLNWKGIVDNQKGEWWLIGQLLFITAHIMPAWPSLHSFNLTWPKFLANFGVFIVLIGITLAARAFLSLGSSLSPLPEPKLGAKLVTINSYKRCRHPLYQGLLISSFGMIVTLGSIFHIVLFIGLCAILIGKAKREERQLIKRHSQYKNYLTNTPAIIAGLPCLDWRV
ncbi:methyltransferase family protein [Prochlorococcus sp. MIT 1307]|uniref:methyltransferase family protein n=1 Tax=Prochlorococcus sp. MIT 1307 TaxID=3096219 RepID=UPI002A74CEB5|nr:methyltransferase [Prochlorococcus sp. MIT 1307]